MSQVTDYNIANASGASVRTDLNAVFDAIKTLNSGGSDPSNTEAFMPFVDTGDSNKLKIRNSSNNGFTTIGPVDTPNLGLLATTGGTMTGALQLKVGNATSPSVHFGQTNTGIFKGSSHRVSFTSDGTQVFYVDGTGININSSKELRWKDSDNSNYIGFKAVSNITNSFTLTLPSADGSSGQALLTNGSGTLSFGAPTVGAANLTGNTLASGVTASSLTSVGTLSSLAVSGTCTARTFSGSGASLTNIPAGQLTGTVADARIASLTSSKLSGALPAIDGSALTGLSTPIVAIKQMKSTSDFVTGTSTSYVIPTGMTMTLTAPSSGTFLLFYHYNLVISPHTGGSGIYSKFKGRVMINGSQSHFWLPEEISNTQAVTRSASFASDGVNGSTYISPNDSIEIRLELRSTSSGTNTRTKLHSGGFITAFLFNIS